MMDVQTTTGKKILKLDNGRFVPDNLAPCLLIIDGKKFEVDSWKEVFLTTLDFISEYDKTLFNNLKLDRVIFKADPTRFMSPATLENGVTIETHFSTGDMFGKIRSILQSSRWNYEIQIAL